MAAAAIIDFILAELDLGRARASVLSKVVKKWQMSDRTFDRHWKKANALKETAREKIKAELAEVERQAAIDALKKAIMGADERRELLTIIARGKLTQTIVDEETMEQNEFPEPVTAVERIKAIAELNKMDGDYAPIKTKTEHSGILDLSTLPITFK